jgi:hypothetical protein
MNPKWSTNHPSVQAWLDYNDDMKYRRQQVRKRMGIKENRKLVRKQWAGLCLLAVVVGGGIGSSGYLLLMGGMVGLFILACTIEKGW